MMLAFKQALESKLMKMLEKRELLINSQQNIERLNK